MSSVSDILRQGGYGVLRDVLACFTIGTLTVDFDRRLVDPFLGDSFAIEYLEL